MNTQPLPTGVGPDTVSASLQELNARLESLGGIIDALEPVVTLLQQAPPLAAVLGDSFDELMRTARDGGVDVEQGLLNGAGAALRFGAVMDPDKVRALEALLQSGVLDPAALQIIGGLGRALIDTASARPAPIGVIGLLKAFGDPDIQRALGFLMNFAARFGSRLPQPQPAR
jgi:hypothetical protein